MIVPPAGVAGHPTSERWISCLLGATVVATRQTHDRARALQNLRSVDALAHRAETTFVGNRFVQHHTFVAQADTSPKIFYAFIYSCTPAAESWLRDVQTSFQEGSTYTESIGIAIDAELAFSEGAADSAPFIFLAVALIILLIAVVHRSYWSAVVVAAGLSATTIAYYGTSALFGLKMGSMLLAFVVPIAAISFGVDFFIHGIGRVREIQVEHGLSAKSAYPAGMAAVFTALLLAASSSIAAFLSNVSSGTEAILQFGLGAAIALGWSYVILGQIAPRVLLGIEQFVGPNPVKGASRVAYGIALVIVAIIGGLAVALAAVMTAVGVAAFVVVLLALLVVPAMLTRGCFDRGGAVVAREVCRRVESFNVADVADDHRSDHDTNTTDVGEGGSRRCDRCAESFA